MSTEFAKYLAQLRRDSGISQREAAAALQVSQALLSHYEKGIREPGLDFVVRAADYYQVSADHLLGRIPPQSAVHASHDTPKEAINQYTQGTEQAIRDALDVSAGPAGPGPGPLAFSPMPASTWGRCCYELLRHFFRLSEEYDPRLFFALSDESL